MAKDACARAEQIESSVKDAPGTLALHARVAALLEARFLPRLRELTNMPDADTATMLDVVDYIDWAYRSRLNLEFELTEEDHRYISLAQESRAYEDFGAPPDY